MRTIIEKLKQKLKGLFTMTPEQIQHAETELKFLFGIIKFCKDEENCPAWKWIRLNYPFWQFIEHCCYWRYNECIMSPEDKEIAQQNLALFEKVKKVAIQDG